jgi:hypothetical protein
MEANVNLTATSPLLANIWQPRRDEQSLSQLLRPITHNGGIKIPLFFYLGVLFILKFCAIYQKKLTDWLQSNVFDASNQAFTDVLNQLR